MRWQEHAAAEPGHMFKNESRKGCFAAVDLKQLLKQGRILGEGGQHFSAKAVPAIHKKHDARHALGQAKNFSMASGITRQIVIGYCAGQQEGLPKADGHALAGDSVSGTGGIADESDVSANNLTKLVRCGDCTPLASGDLSMHQLLP
jgi:hypothetical protein